MQIFNNQMVDGTHGLSNINKLKEEYKQSKTLLVTPRGIAWNGSIKDIFAVLLDWHKILTSEAFKTNLFVV